MRILPRYFVLNFFRGFAAILFVSLIVIAIIEMMVNFDHVLEHGEGLTGVGSYLFLRLPSYYLPYLLPIASFGAAFLALGMPARALEVLAAKASGIAPARLAAPVLAAAAVLALATLAVNETLVLETARRYERAAESTAQQRRLFQSRGSFWYQRGPMLFSVESADRETRMLHGVRVYERDGAGRLVRSIRAETARIEADHRWRLEQAVVREFTLDDPAAAPRTSMLAETWIEVGSEEDLALLDADPRSLPLAQLSRYIEALERDQRDAARARELWHARASEPASVLLFALLGAPLGAAVERSRSLAVPALQGIAVVGAFYAAQTGLSLLTGALPAAAVVAPWLLLGAFGAWGAWRWLQMGR